MTQWLRSVASSIQGAEEFGYLLGACLFNYGSVITEGMYEHAIQMGGSSTGSLHDAPQGDSQVESGDAKRGEAESIQSRKRRPTPDCMSKEPDRSSKSSRTHSSCSKRAIHSTSEPSGSGKDELDQQLRETIRATKVDMTSSDAHDLSEVAGLDDVKQALEEFACFFLHFPHLTRDLRQRSATGILLFGPQGTGKTLVVRSFARRYNLALYDVRASAVMSKWVGEAEKFVSALFAEVRGDAPAVLLLDECDGLLSSAPNYRLLQNELKNQWSDLIYSRDEVIVIGATNKPHDIDMDGFGRRLSLKLHVGLPVQEACWDLLRQALSRVRHVLDEDEIRTLGTLCHNKGLSGYDIECLVEAQLRRALRSITLSGHFRHTTWQEAQVLVPCGADAPGAIPGSWDSIAKGREEELSYVPLDFSRVCSAVLKARATVDHAMLAKHQAFAREYGTGAEAEEDDELMQEGSGSVCLDMGS